MEAKSKIKGRVATVGTFDGLHRGHHKVLETAMILSKDSGQKPLVVYFDRHPLETIAPEKAPACIQSPTERHDILSRNGYESLIVEFSPEVARLTAREWLVKMRDTHHVGTIVIGYDNTFGSDGRNMSLSDYKKLGEQLGMEVIEAPVEPGISSSSIRKALTAGNVEEASAMLGRPYTITGKVVRGQQIGRKLGFPTANIFIPYDKHLPANGVYAAEAMLPDGRCLPAVVNIGHRPTLGENGRISVEAHIIHLHEDLYGAIMTLRLLKRIRPEIKFDSLDRLSEQIREDIRDTLALFFDNSQFHR